MGFVGVLGFKALEKKTEKGFPDFSAPQVVALPRTIDDCYISPSRWGKLAVVPCVSIPLVIRTFCRQFASIFKRPEQYTNFEALITGLVVSENKTIAGIYQCLPFGPTYESLHHFMTESPWSVDDLRLLRLRLVKERMVTRKKDPDILCIAASNATAYGASKNGGNNAGGTPNDTRCSPQNPHQSSDKELRIAQLDATFTHHTTEGIYGVYWYWDYAKHSYTLAQRLVISSLVNVGKLVPLGWKVYHRGFLADQKLFLEAQKPAPNADETAWQEYNELLKQYEQNEMEHKTQPVLAGELVDESEEHNLGVDVYVCDAALGTAELLDKIAEYGKAWVTRLSETRLVQTAKGGYEQVRAFAKSLPKDAFKPVDVETRHGEKRRYWCFTKCVMIKNWKKVRMVISYDNEQLDGDPIYIITNRKNWNQPKRVVQLYMRRDPIEHLIRDGKQEIGLEDSQQRKQDAVRRHWELSFTAHTFLELGFEVPNLPGVPTVKLETIGQKTRLMKGALLQGLVNLVAQWVLEGRDLKEFIWLLMLRRLDRRAA